MQVRNAAAVAAGAVVGFLVFRSVRGKQLVKVAAGAAAAYAGYLGAQRAGDYLVASSAVKDAGGALPRGDLA
jgi:uncharacterized membrane protein YjjB (DUF3815 family)